MDSENRRHNQRREDALMVKIIAVAERVLLWATVLGLVASMATAYVRIKDTVGEFPSICQKVTTLETRGAVDDERWTRLEKWMERIDRRLDRGR
jgi:hypothetical protein